MSEAVKNKLAMEIAFAGRCRHDVSEDAHEFWANSSGETRGVAFRQADAAILQLAPQWQPIETIPAMKDIVVLHDDGTIIAYNARYGGFVWDDQHNPAPPIPVKWMAVPPTE